MHAHNSIIIDLSSSSNKSDAWCIYSETWAWLIILSLLEDGGEDTLNQSNCKCYHWLLLPLWILGSGRKRGRSGGDEGHFTRRGKGVDTAALWASGILKIVDIGTADAANPSKRLVTRRKTAIQWICFDKKNAYQQMQFHNIIISS